MTKKDKEQKRIKELFKDLTTEKLNKISFAEPEEVVDYISSNPQLILGILRKLHLDRNFHASFRKIDDKIYCVVYTINTIANDGEANYLFWVYGINEKEDEE